MKSLNNNQVRAFAAMAVLTVLIASAGLASAQGPRHGGGKGMMQGMGQGGPGEFGPGHRIEMMAKRLDLSEEQLTAIKQIHENSRKDGLQKRKELMRLRNELKGEMMKDSPSEKTVLGINSKMGELKTEMKALKLKTRLAVREELTAEQRDQMLVMGGHGGKGGRGGHGGFGGCDGPDCGPRQNGGGKGQGMGPRNSPDCRFNQ